MSIKVNDKLEEVLEGASEQDMGIFGGGEKTSQGKQEFRPAIDLGSSDRREDEGFTPITDSAGEPVSERVPASKRGGRFGTGGGAAKHGGTFNR
jgi:hypothetical protein